MIRCLECGSKAHIKYAKKLYKTAFPKCERFPWWVLYHSAKSKNAYLSVILKDDTPVGMRFVIKYDGIVYLMYYAIDERYRNHDIGGEILRNTAKTVTNVLLCIERPINDGIELRRKNFYLQNGFYETGCYIEDGDVEYEFLSSVKGFQVTPEILQNRYLKMSDNPFLKWFIGKCFNAGDIQFIN